MFRIHRREAGHFRQGRAFLLGDAAHIHSPVGGQGMNMGMQDSFNLAWKLGLVIGQGGNPALLDSYEPERRPIDEAVLRQTDRATRLVSLHGTVTRFVRDHLMSLATRLPVVVEKLGEVISGIAIDYRDSPIVEDHAIGAPGPHAGDRAPDALVGDCRIGGGSTRLYELFEQHRQMLLMVGEGAGATPNLPELARRGIAVRHVTAAGDSGGDLIDTKGEIAKRYGSMGTAYLIRPDGYVGFRCTLNDTPRYLPGHLAKLFAGG